MSSSIESYSDLMKEKKRLETALSLQKQMIKQDISELKDELIPIANIATHVKKLFSRDIHNPLVNVGISVASDMVLKNFILARTGWVSRLIVPYLVKNYSSHFINKKVDKIKHDIKIKPESTRILSNGHSNFFHKLGEKLKS